MKKRTGSINAGRNPGCSSRRACNASVSRLHWLLSFVLLFLACSAVPVLAEPVPEVPIVDSSTPGMPDENDLANAIAKLKGEEAQQDEWLLSPEAIQGRESSQTAYAQADPSEAEELLRSSFGKALEALDSDPARFLSDAKLDQALGETAGTVTSDGETMLMDSTVPVRVENDDGSLGKVDLSLQASGEDLVSVNPIVELKIPERADEGIDLGEGELSIRQVGAEGGGAVRRFGDTDAFYADIQPSTDLLVSPISSGVELFNQLRSEESPEALRFELQTPPGSELRGDGLGGAEVRLSNDQALAHISPPKAVDAQGTPVPVELQIDGDALVLAVAHRDEDFAYPILVDPEFVWENWYTANWYNGLGLSALTDGTWTWQQFGAEIYHDTKPIYKAWGGSNRGLYISTPPHNWASNLWGQFIYTVPDWDSYIDHASLLPMWRDTHGCNANLYQNPVDYDGLYDGTQYIQLRYNEARYLGYSNLPAWGKLLVVGLGTMEGGNDPCGRSLYIGGAGVWLDDWAAPVVNSVSGAPSGWIDGTAPFTITSTTSDNGLGVRKVTISPEGSPIIQDWVGCIGTRSSPCPASRTSSFPLTGASFDEGEKYARLTAEDPTGKMSGTSQWLMKVDRTPPEVTLAGQLAMATSETGSEEKEAGKGDELKLPVYNLKIEAKDGSNASGATKRSGVKNIEIFFDGSATPAPVTWLPQSCPASSCSMTKTSPIKMNGLGVGKHTLRILVKDQVGNKRERQIEFEYFPATGMKDEYVMQYFPLPNGEGDEAEEEEPKRPELAVNVMNGNLVYREQDVAVPGAGAALEVERYYNSLLPNSENTEWGDGWTLAQTPALDVTDTGGSPVAEIVDPSGATDGNIGLPTDPDKSQFDSALQATLTKYGDGYEMRDETGKTDSTVVFDESGKPTELKTGEYASVDYDYQEGDLSQISVIDPASASPPSEQIEEPSFQSSFGTLGTGNGQFKSPVDVDVDAKRNLYVADRENNRIEIFNGSGQFVKAFGSVGTANGQFKQPSAVAIDPEGDIWVGERTGSRVQQFTKDGEFISKFGSAGSGPTQFTGIEGLAIDPSGNLYIADSTSSTESRIRKFKPNGELIKQIASQGSGTGQVKSPAALDLDAAGNIYVADRSNLRIEVFNPAGEFIREWKSSGGSTFKPGGLDVDAKGTVWVAEIDHNRIEGFSQYGDPIAQFGSPGAGEGQFDFATVNPNGLVVEPSGDIWIADARNNRIQRWMVEGIDYELAFQSSFGATGTANGQFKSPADIAIDTKRNLYVADRENHRIEIFDGTGEFVKAFGTNGTGNGQFKQPSAVAIDPEGDIWVAERTGSRVQQFTKDGEFISKFGSSGIGSAQFINIEGLAIGADGNLYISDTSSLTQNCVRKFKPDGELIKVIASQGSGPGQVKTPAALDLDASGNLYVADRGNSRIDVFSSTGEFVREWKGSGAGTFKPGGVDVDPQGTVWVTDIEHKRIQGFNQYGTLLAQFGSAGSGEGQLNLTTNPHGLVADPSGDIWLTDVGNNRVQKWVVEDDLPAEAIEDDPSLEVEVDGGLVSEVQGEQAGEHSYEHNGELLTAATGPEGTTDYDYDGVGRLTKVTLPNGTFGEVKYDVAYGRVSQVTIDPAGAEPAKTTHFEYLDEPRRTTVVPDGKPAVTYDIGEDGSVLKWWNAIKAPDFDDLAGALYANRETSAAINPGDYNLVTQAHSEEGIASIQVIANGNQLVDERTCEQDFGKPGIECVTLINEWVTETGNWAPGIVSLEVTLTDRLGGSSSRRFWVNIPYTPPPAPEELPRPKFADILSFREEYGLDLDLNPALDEMALNDRIFDLIGWWYNPHTPLGEVARSSSERWGVPLRPEDVAELMYREAYLQREDALIPQWAHDHPGSGYGGYYIDHRQGGILHVGFTSNQGAQVASLKQSLQASGLPEYSRVEPYATPPVYSLFNLGEMLGTVVENPGAGSIRQVALDDDQNILRVGAQNTAAAAAWISAHFGPSAPFIIEDASWRATADRWVTKGPIKAGHGILRQYKIGTETWHTRCTAGLGAYEKLESNTNQPIFARFVLTAGHCGLIGQTWGRTDAPEGFETPFKPIGTSRRNSIEHELRNFATDSQAIRLDDGFDPPRTIVAGPGEGERRITGVTKAVDGMPVCSSGAVSAHVHQSHLQPETWFISLPKKFAADGEVEEWYPYMYEPTATLRVVAGDSGGPVWRCGTGQVIGLLSAVQEGRSITGIAPLLPPDEPEETLNRLPFFKEQAPGILAAPDMGSIQITTTD